MTTPSRMFWVVDDTWNIVTGCTHDCGFCWAKKLCYERLCKMIPHYAEHGFRPALQESQLKRKWKPNIVVFVTDMGDLFCDAVPDEWIELVIRQTYRFPSTNFLFCTKNPARYDDFLDMFGDNCILGTTTETNRDELVRPLTNAPLPSERYDALLRINFPRKFLSIEPIMKFDLPILLDWIRNIRPEACEIGYDNYGFRLPEPSESETRTLIRLKRMHEIRTFEKTIRKAWWE